MSTPSTLYERALSSFCVGKYVFRLYPNLSRVLACTRERNYCTSNALVARHRTGVKSYTNRKCYRTAFMLYLTGCIFVSVNITTENVDWIICMSVKICKEWILINVIGLLYARSCMISVTSIFYSRVNFPLTEGDKEFKLNMYSVASNGRLE